MSTRPAQTHEIWICGFNPVKEALHGAHASVTELVLSRGDSRASELAMLARARGVALRREAFDTLSMLVGHTHHQGVALRSGEFRYTPLETLLNGPALARQPLLALDSVQDPQNLGALIRSACFLGVKGMIVPKDRSATISSTVIKIASGAAAYLPISQVVNLAQTLGRLKDSGLWVVGMDVGGDQVLYEADLSMPLALVVGNEQKGLRPLIRRNCDFLVRIPAGGPLESLNAATAGAIALAEVQRQQRGFRKAASSQKGPSQS